MVGGGHELVLYFEYSTFSTTDFESESIGLFLIINFDCSVSMGCVGYIIPIHGICVHIAYFVQVLWRNTVLVVIINSLVIAMIISDFRARGIERGVS